MYRAYGATVSSFGPFSALYFYFYETMKGKFVDNQVQAYRNKANQLDDKGVKAAHSKDIGFF